MNILKKTNESLIFKISIAAVLSIFFIYIMAIYLNSNNENISFFGQFGDSFGVLNSLFTGLGFSGLITTIYIQQKQLKQQAIENLKRENENASLFNLESILSAYTEAEILLEDKNNDRATWIRAGRLLKHAKQLEPNLIPIHKIRLETKQLKIRSSFSALLSSKAPHFFYGIHADQAKSLEEAVDIIGDFYEIDGMNYAPFSCIIPEASIKAVWEAGEWPSEYTDPLGKGFNDDEKRKLKFRYSNILLHIQHMHDYKKLKKELYNQKQKKQI
ncbi:hypothetical protein [Janthinobacterium rivuli]|uniref:hypothetical protein n=1 Tax=Janthinobacterium rivuli TaxID=2751478 RepID=UPI00383BB83A